MKHHYLSATLALALTAAVPAQAQLELVNPVPQEVESRGSAFAIPQAWRVSCEAAREGTYPVKALTLLPISREAKARYRLTMGCSGDKAVKKYEKRIPAQAEGYYLHVTPREAVVAARDERGLYYGVQTLRGMMEKGELQECDLTDYPDVAARGVVEGFYGTPWSHEARLSQLAFYGRYKMNTYIYGSKDDPYHRDHWRDPYPEQEGKRIQELCEAAKACGVDFYWAIHPGIDIKWTDADRDALVHKLELMYALGVRAFAVFFDDIWGEGTRADKQAELLNYVHDNFIARHAADGVRPLVLCPTEYNRSWVNEKKGYLRTLGAQLHKDIRVMWTGNTVVHCIDREGTEWVNERIQRKAYIWWNFPVSDFVRDHVLLGPAYGNDLDIAPLLSGFVSNPMEHAEASKIALHGIASYAWNMRDYDYRANWEAAIRRLLPGNAAALRTFALYNKDLAANNHGFRREEGEEMKYLLDMPAEQVPGDSLIAIGQRLVDACDTLLSDESNPELLRELRPWLAQGAVVGSYAQVVGMLHKAGGNPAEFEAQHRAALQLQKTMYLLEGSKLRHPLQPGIKVGEGALMPLLARVFEHDVRAYNAANATALSDHTRYQPYTLTATVPQLANQAVEERNGKVSVRPVLEVITWGEGESLTIACDRAVTMQGLDLNLGAPGMAQHFTLELQNEAGEWKPVSLLHYKDSDPVIHTGEELGGMTATTLRLTNTSGKPQQVLFKNFNFVAK